MMRLALCNFQEVMLDWVEKESTLMRHRIYMATDAQIVKSFLQLEPAAKVGVARIPVVVSDQGSMEDILWTCVAIPFEKAIKVLSSRKDRLEWLAKQKHNDYVSRQQYWYQEHSFYLHAGVLYVSPDCLRAEISRRWRVHLQSSVKLIEERKIDPSAVSNDSQFKFLVNEIYQLWLTLSSPDSKLKISIPTWKELKDAWKSRRLPPCALIAYDDWMSSRGGKDHLRLFINSFSLGLGISDSGFRAMWSENGIDPKKQTEYDIKFALSKKYKVSSCHKMQQLVQGFGKSSEGYFSGCPFVHSRSRVPNIEDCGIDENKKSPIEQCRDYMQINNDLFITKNPVEMTQRALLSAARYSFFFGGGVQFVFMLLCCRNRKGANVEVVRLGKMTKPHIPIKMETQ